MTEPTDAELAALIDKEMREYSVGAYADHGSAKNQLEHFARAVLAKWGGQPAHSGQPVAWLDPWTGAKVTTDYDAYGKHGIPLYTTQQPTQAQPTQAQARAVPLTPEAINVMAREYPAEDLCGWSYRMGVADAEAHHGIKGGQHGTE